MRIVGIIPLCVACVQLGLCAPQEGFSAGAVVSGTVAAAAVAAVPTDIASLIEAIKPIPRLPTEYVVLSANITSELATNPNLHNETFSVVVAGSDPGALPANCTVTWDAWRANGESVTVPLKCTDKAVLVSLTKENVVDFVGWDLSVQQR